MRSYPIISNIGIKPVNIPIPLFFVLVVLLLTAGCTGQTGNDIKGDSLIQQNTVMTPAHQSVTPLSDQVTSPAELDKKSPILLKEKYVFFEHHIHITGVPLNGTCSPGMNIDFPTYSFNADSGKLTISSLSGLKKVNESVILIHGTGESRDGLAGSGAGTVVFAVYSMPYSFSEGGNVTFDSVMADGTVFFRYDNRHLSLKPNETWENVTRIVEKYGPPNHRFNCTAEFITTDRFYNAGILEKKNIVTG